MTVGRGSASVAVVVPIKAFAHAKARLSNVLDPGERAALARSMATAVVEAAARDGFAVVVVTDDDEVDDWASGHGATVVRPSAPGLDAAARAGVDGALALGPVRVVVAHGDLPHATTFAHVAERGEDVVIVPDRHRDGTNVIALDGAAAFEFHYGPGSFDAHCAEAARLGLTVGVLDDPALAWDVDVAADLTRDMPPAGDGSGRTGRSTQ
jgi:2-phospho-L-lactate guanylyltransferase